MSTANSVQDKMSIAKSIVEVNIDDLSAALASGNVTSVDLVSKYLLRIATYDTRNTCLNSIPLINNKAFDEAAASDDRRAKGQTLGRLDGIPFTVKDSYKVKGMTVASGSIAFQHLVASEDAFTVKTLKDAGAVLIGKTNMCPMAYGGMLRGVYGRAESPYNLDYLPAAFGSGSSNGSGVSVAASFAAFGMGEETVSSGRSPASNNALVAYTPSRGVISIRGNWPLYPTCDVVVPHTRSVDDLCRVLDVIAAQDQTTIGDFWRDQPFIDLSALWEGWPKDFMPSKDAQFLKTKRIAVPRMYIEHCEHSPYVSKSIQPLWAQAHNDLVELGAEVEIVEEFPIMTAYEEPSTALSEQSQSTPRLPNGWNSIERGELIAHAWEDFLQQNHDTNCMSLVGVNPESIFPHLPREDPQVKFTEPSNAVQWAKLASFVQHRSSPLPTNKGDLFSIRQLEDAAKALEAMRLKHFEEWMEENHFDYVVFPAAGDVAQADSDINDKSAKHAWTNGVKYSHGNRALRHLGIPSVTVCMGIIEDKQMPMGLTFLGRAYDDINIINAASAYEQHSQRRVSPPLTPEISTDIIPSASKVLADRLSFASVRCFVSSTTRAEEVQIKIDGIVARLSDQSSNQEFEPSIDIFIDGIPVLEQSIQLEMRQQDEANFNCIAVAKRPRMQASRDQVVGKIARDSIMIMVLAKNGEGRPTGDIRLIHASDIV